MYNVLRSILGATIVVSSCGCSAKLELPAARLSQNLNALVDASAPDNPACSLDSGALPLDALRLGEVVIDPPGTDGNYEFVELQGAACANVGGSYLVCVEGDSESNPGSVDRVVNLGAACGNSPCQLGADGRLVLAAAGGWQKPDESKATWTSISALTGGGLENGTTTLLLLECTTAPTAGSDWDPTDTGLLQIPLGCQLLDSLCWLDRANGDFAYSTTVVGPKPAAGAAVRCGEIQQSSDWYFGALVNGAVGIEFGGTLSNGAPPPGTLTPGMPNSCPLVTLIDAGSSALPDVSLPDADAPILSDSGMQASSAGGNQSAAAEGSTGAGGSSSWWLPDVKGTWPDASQDESANPAAAEASSSNGAPNITPPSCSLNARRKGSLLEVIAIGAFLLRIAAKRRKRPQIQ